MIGAGPSQVLTMLVVVLLFVGFWVGVALLVRALIRGGSRPSVTAQPSVVPDPVHVLDERLARGKIDPADYAERRRLLEGGRAP